MFALLAIIGLPLLGIGVIFYQVIIFTIVKASGSTGRWIVAPLACLWTLTHVFFPPLMILQFIVIFAAFCSASED